MVVLDTLTGFEVGGRIARASDADVPLLDAMDGPRVCLGTARGPYNDARGVTAASGSSDLRGLYDSAFACTGASESGGDGGVGASDSVSDFGGGVEGVVELGVIPLASLAGLLVRRLSTASGLGFRVRSRSMVPSASLSFSSVISLSTLRSPSSSRRR